MTMKMALSAVNKALCGALDAFCAANKLPNESADALKLRGDLTPEQGLWLHDFVGAWEAYERVERWQCRHVGELPHVMPPAASVGGLLRSLECRDPAEPIAYATWDADDVRSLAEDFEPPAELTDKEVATVLQRLYKHHDCEYGITWDRLGQQIDDVLAERDE